MSTKAKDLNEELRPRVEALVKLNYQSGLGNEFQTEALPGALPIGQNSPQKLSYGLISELVSGTTFSAPRSLNRRAYLFRIRPSVLDGRFEKIDSQLLRTPPLDISPSPNHYAWGPFKGVKGEADFVDSLATICGNGGPAAQHGMAIHVYAANKSMRDRVFSSADGEMLIAPHLGALRVFTEFGMLDLRVGDISVIPKGIKFRVELLEKFATGFACENFGLPLRLPELGLIGSNGLANVNDFEIPVAAFEDRDIPTQLVHKFAGNLWTSKLNHSPLNVVAWRGSLYPYKYDLRRFVAMGTGTVDHPDPSIFCLLSSPSDHLLGPNFDVMALTPRWVVGDHTFLAPGYHRNCVGEFIVLLQGAYGGLETGSATMTNNWTPHGPETDTLEALREGTHGPIKVDNMLGLLFESRFPIQTTQFAESILPNLTDYTKRWDGFNKRFQE